MPHLLDPETLARECATLPEWVLEGSQMTRTFRFGAYLEGIAFVDEVAKLAEQMDHHPDIHIGWRKVTLRTTTHSKGGLTGLDIVLARRVDALQDRLRD